jgi:hypothetical protein
MLNIKKFYAWLVNTLNSKVNRAGDTLSGELKVVIPDGSAHARLRAQCYDEDSNLLSDGALESSLSGNTGFYDYKHGRWVCRNDADGRPHVPVSPAVLNTAKVACTTIGTSYKYTSVPGLSNWSIVAVHFIVHEVTQILIFFRGEAYDRSLTDNSNSSGRFRGTIIVDWNNNRIGIRAIQSGNSTTYVNLIYFDYVYGIL